MGFKEGGGVGWFILCAVGMTASFSIYGVCLEYTTTGARKQHMHEISFILITTLINALVALCMRWVVGEASSQVSKYDFLLLSFTSIGSTFSSILSLRYVIYPVQLLAKSCKPVPVMLFGALLGKRYSIYKYLNVLAISIGFVLFMNKGVDSSSDLEQTDADVVYYGAIALLIISLCFDGFTGAFEDRLMEAQEIGPFDLMFNIQLGKALMSLAVLLLLRQQDKIIHVLQSGGPLLVVIGVAGAAGQIFVFLTINKFGALNCSLIGLGRKILSLLLSFIVYGHHINMIQLLGLLISVAAMVFHVLEKGSNGFRSPRSTSNLLTIASTNSLASMPLSASSPELNEQVHHEEGRHHSRSSSINIVNNSDH